MKNELDKLLQKKMDRRDFLKHIGIGFAAVAGVTTVLKTLNGEAGTRKQISQTSYGGGPYGGSKVNRRS